MITVSMDDIDKIAAVAEGLKVAQQGTGPFPVLTPSVMNDWMGEWEESFMADGPIDPPREIKEKLESQFIEGVYKLDKNILDVLLANNCGNTMEFIWDVYIDDLTEEQEDTVYQLYCDVVNSLNINTTAAFDVREDDEDEDDEDE